MKNKLRDACKNIYHSIYYTIIDRIPVLTEAIAKVTIGILWPISHHIRWFNIYSQQFV